MEDYRKIAIELGQTLISKAPETREDVERMLPELKESEDERIRKALITLLQHFCKGYRVSGLDFPVSYKDMLAWLEKQGEWKIAEWSEEDEIALGDALWAIQQARTIAKDENDMGNLWYAENWLKSLKDRVQPQSKQEWSKEDENNILFLTSIIEECFKDKEKITLYGDTVCASFTKENVIDRLKSLRPHKQWKPSDEQMDALSKAIAFVFDSNSDVKHSLESLYNELKKLF